MYAHTGLMKKMPDDSLVALEFKNITLIEATQGADEAEEGTARCECGKEFMYSVHYEENLRQVNGDLVFRCPRCYALSDRQVEKLIKTGREQRERENSTNTKR